MSNVLKTLMRGGAVAPTDEYFNQTTLLLHGDGTNGAQNNTFLDSSTNTFTITRNGNTTQGTFSPFSAEDGKWSVYTAANSYINTSTSSDFTCGTGAFTIEFWLNPNSTSPGYVFDLQSWSPRMTIFVEGAYLQIYDGTYRILGTIKVGEWAHWAICRTSTTDNKIYFYKNGVYQGSFSGGAASTSASWTFVRLGGYTTSGYSLDGHYSNARMIKGQNLMSGNPTGNFDPPTGPISASEVVWGGANVDSSITGTVALVTAQSNRFINNAGNAVTLATFSGTNSIQPLSPLAPSAAYSPSVNGGSGYFDGTGDYLVLGSSGTAAQLGTGDFCAEAWFYSGSTATQYIFNNFNGSGSADTQWAMYDQTSEFRFGGWSTNFLVGTKPPRNQWNHVVVCRASGTMSLFINGVREATSATARNLSASNNMQIGAHTGSTSPFNGYITQTRLVKGDSVYDPTQTTLTVPTAPLTAITNTEALVSFTNAGIFDNTGKHNLDAISNAQVSTGTVKFGTGSMSFNGTGYLSLSSLTLVQFLTKNFTVEFWLNLNSTAQQYFVDWGTGIIYCASGGQLRYFGNGTLRISGPTLSTGTWYHIALCRNNGSTRMFVDGTQVGVTYADTFSYAPTSFHIGGSSPDLDGFIDDLRITDAARYTSSFTVPDKAFPDL